MKQQSLFVLLGAAGNAAAAVIDAELYPSSYCITYVSTFLIPAQTGFSAAGQLDGSIGVPLRTDDLGRLPDTRTGVGFSTSTGGLEPLFVSSSTGLFSGTDDLRSGDVGTNTGLPAGSGTTSRLPGGGSRTDLAGGTNAPASLDPSNNNNNNSGSQTGTVPGPSEYTGSFTPSRPGVLDVSRSSTTGSSTGTSGPEPLSATDSLAGTAGTDSVSSSTDSVTVSALVESLSSGNTNQSPTGTGGPAPLSPSSSNVGTLPASLGSSSPVISGQDSSVVPPTPITRVVSVSTITVTQSDGSETTRTITVTQSEGPSSSGSVSIFGETSNLPVDTTSSSSTGSPGINTFVASSRTSSGIIISLDTASLPVASSSASTSGTPTSSTSASGTLTGSIISSTVLSSGTRTSTSATSTVTNSVSGTPVRLQVVALSNALANGYVGGPGDPNPDTCGNAIVFSLDQNKLFDDNGAIFYNGTEDYKQLRGQGDAPFYAITTSFEIVNGYLEFINRVYLPNGRAGFCRDPATGQVYIKFPSGPPGCVSVRLSIQEGNIPVLN